MPPQHAAPSETSPLLPKQDEVPNVVAEPSSGLTPDSTAAAHDGVVQDPEDPNALQRQDSAKDRERQYEGMPEIRKTMKYMFPALGVGVFLAAADQTIVVSSYTKIGNDLDALNKTGWIATAYFLTLTSFQPLFGKLSDIFGRKPCLLFAYLIFGLGCLGCGLCKDIDQLIVARAIAGVGGGGMTTVVSILLSDVIALRDRGTWQGYINIIYAAGAGTGAPLGGLFSDGPGWRWSFLFQAPLCLVAFVAVFICLKLPKKEDSEWKEKLRRIDFLGAAILVCAVFALLLGLDRGSNDSWRPKLCLIPLCISFPLFAVFIYVETKVAAEPFAPGHIIFDRSLFAGYLCNFFSFAGYLATLFYAPLYFQVVGGHSATVSGLLLLPSIISGVSGSLFAGFYMKKTGKYYWLTVVCYANLTLGLILVVLFSGLVLKSDVAICVGMALCGFSNGIGVTSSLIALISNARRDDQAVVTACSYLFRSLGSTTGVSLSSSAANQTLRATLHKQLSSGKDAEKIIDHVRRNLAYIKRLSPSQQNIVRYCYMLSTRAAFSLQIGLVAGAAISAWFIREKPLSK